MKPGFVHWTVVSVIALGVHGIILQAINRGRPVVPIARPAPELSVNFLLNMEELVSAAQLPAKIHPANNSPLQSQVERAPEPDSAQIPIPQTKPKPEPAPEETPEPGSKPKRQPEPAREDTPKPRSKPKRQPEPVSPPKHATKPKIKPKLKTQPMPVSKSAVATSNTATGSSSSKAVPSPVNKSQATSVKDISAELSDYYQALGRRLAHAKKYPRMALMRRQQGTVKLRLLVAADGTILKATIASASPYRVLNNAALKLADTSSPLPKPPAGAKVPLEVVVPIAYRIE